MSLLLVIAAILIGLAIFGAIKLTLWSLLLILVVVAIALWIVRRA